MKKTRADYDMAKKPLMVKVLFLRHKKRRNWYFLIDCTNERNIGWYHIKKLRYMFIDLENLHKKIMEMPDKRLSEGTNYHNFLNRNPNDLKNQTVGERWLEYIRKYK